MILSFEVLEWSVKDLVVVCVNSFVFFLATDLHHVINALSPVDILLLLLNIIPALDYG